MRIRGRLRQYKELGGVRDPRRAQIDTTLNYASLYDGTLAADYYSAMNKVERQLALPEDSAKEPPEIGELIALPDALRNGSLNPTQTEIVRALREGLGLLEDVKVQPAPLTQ